MGLKERRATKEFQENHFPALVERIHAAYGGEPVLEVDWSSIAVDGMAHMYETAFTKVYFETLIQAFEAVGIDEMGKEALQEGVEKVVITNTDAYANHRGFSFNEGVLTLDHKPTYNIDNVQERVKALTTLLENNL
ncbi:hypothetical protein FRC96_04725 [Lujinxingia vulgaris]|uniref:Uncharacterized protein n=1 Tax=Lujinxingia vulgaris TaxID=2600176 RepID=A0A5C6XK82_9DELT|nr:hypothetical protein [Lujinxingia vulgaris]TXD41170.1 hypothetical protein FRC96_04725 [Lujinxingia vulgaris]